MAIKKILLSIATIFFAVIFLSPASGLETKGVKESGLFTGTISGSCFNDVNQNGKKDAGEAGVEGITVSLKRLVFFIFPMDAGSAAANADGTYEITGLQPGLYLVEVENKSGAECTTKNPVRTWLGFFKNKKTADFGFTVTDVEPEVIATAVILGVTAPVNGATPTSTITATTEYTATIAWSPADNPFAASTAYTATITITPKAGYTLTGVAANFFTVAGAEATNAINSGVVTAVFPSTAATLPVPIATAAIAGVTAPVTGATPTAAIADTTEYTATIAWSPADNPFAASTVYTATITITPKAGYTLTGVTANFFTVAGATSATNAAGSGVVTAVFSACLAIDSYQWHTFYGSDTADRAYGIAVDKTDNAYIVGRSKSTWNGPTEQPPLHDHSDSGVAADIFVLKLDKNGAYQWHTFYGAAGDENYVDYAYAAVCDEDSNVYITGFSYGSWTGPDNETPKHAYSGYDAGDSNAFVLKLNQAGAYQWHTFYGVAGTFEEGRAIALDANAGIYVAMKSETTWNGPDNETPLHEYSGGTGDITVLKLTGDGDYVWHTFYGAAGSSAECFSIAFFDNSSLYVAGLSSDNWTGQAPKHAYAGGNDITVLKLNSAGAYQWHTFYGSDSGEAGRGDEARGITVDESGNVYLTGKSGAEWQGDGGAEPRHPFQGGDDIMVLKLCSNGEYQWHTFYGSALADDYGNDITTSSEAGVFIAGRGLATWQGDNNDNPLHGYAGSEDILVMKLDGDGNYRWHTFYGSAQSYGSASNDRSQDIALDSREFIHTVGYSQALWLGDNSSTPLHNYSGSDDMFDLVLKDAF